MTGPDCRVALIGYGLAGRVFHAPVLSAVEGLELAAVVTSFPERAAQVNIDVPNAELLVDPASLWARAQEYDVVVIATPNRTHAPLALAAVAAGLAVVVDKPLARTAEEGAAVVRAAAAAGVLLTVFHNRRWDADTRTAARLLADGSLGEPLRLETRFERWRPQLRDGWRESADPLDGGGLLLDLGSHQVDVALHLLGPVSTVYAELDRRRPGAAMEDDVMIALRHVSGARSTHWLSATAAQLGPRLRLLGSRAAFVVSELDGQEDALRAGGRPGPGWGAVPAYSWGVLSAGDRSEPVPSLPGDYRLFYAGLLAALRGDGAPPVTGAEAVDVLRVLDAARLSAERAQVVFVRS
ncbi:MAG: Gfo/Idh/MocA family oxidoreductase [Mycobacteriales bacterium]